MFSQYTTYLANHLCGGSSRKLIAGWWYSILGMTIAITLLSLTMISNNNNNNNSNNNNGTNDSSANTHQCIIALWSSFLLCCFSIGGTMIMRKFHNSIAVGFFMGVTVTSCQFYIGLAFLYFHYRHYNIHNNNNNNRTNGSSAKDVTLFAYLSLVQAILLGSFAIILAAHRTEISFDSTAEEHHLPISNNQDLHPPKADANTNNNSIRNSEGMYQAPPRSNHHRRT
jgi:formate-dependent nitrite reductase membrane component NrfD